MGSIEGDFRRTYQRRWLGGLFLVFLTLASCSPNVTESEEYLLLEAERDDALAAQTNAEQKLADVQEDFAAAVTELADAEAGVADSESQITELEAAIEEEKARIEPYGEAVTALFVEGCAEEDPVLEATCLCLIGELEEVMTVGEFFEVSVAFFELPVDPVTGFPSNSAIAAVPGAEIFFDVFFDCLFQT